MCTVPSDDEDGINRLIFEEVIRISAGSPKPEFAFAR